MITDNRKQSEGIIPFFAETLSRVARIVDCLPRERDPGGSVAPEQRGRRAAIKALYHPESPCFAPTFRGAPLEYAAGQRNCSNRESERTHLQRRRP